MDCMPPLPGGTVTFVFTDIEGSTRLLQQLGDDYADVADAHRRIVREAFTARSGTEVDTQGDAFFYSFPRARDAVAAAVDAQRALAAHPWPDGSALKVRMGVHTGEPAVGEAGYIGLDVHRAARICASGHGGQVLLSDATKALVGTAMPDGVQVQDLGEHALKDIDGREHLWGLAVDGLPGSFPPPRTSAGPNPLESREKQIEARIEQYVLDSIEQAFRPKSEVGPKARGLGGLAAVGMAVLAGLVLILILIVVAVKLLFF
jgi:class 3 adenylate cyclase